MISCLVTPFLLLIIPLPFVLLYLLLICLANYLLTSPRLICLMHACNPTTLPNLTSPVPCSLVPLMPAAACTSSPRPSAPEPSSLQAPVPARMHKSPLLRHLTFARQLHRQTLRSDKGSYEQIIAFLRLHFSKAWKALRGRRVERKELERGRWTDK